MPHTVPRRPLTVFISYVHEDSGICDSLNNALRNAFGDLITVFVDKVSIQQGANIRDTISDNLAKVDLLFVISTGTERPSHDWAGFELGYFNGTHQKSEANKSLWQGQSLWGTIVILCAPGTSPRPENQRKYIELDVRSVQLEKSEEEFGHAVNIDNSDPLLMLFGEILYSITGEKLHDRQIKIDSYKRILIDFKRKVFGEFKQRPKMVLRPQRQIIVHYDSEASVNDEELFAQKTKVTLRGGAGAIFGISGVDEGTPMPWVEFYEALKSRPLARYWKGALLRLIAGAATGRGIDIDKDQLISSSDQSGLFRLILTRATTYHNHMVDASIYLVEVDQSKYLGNARICVLARALQLATRFRCLFLESSSEFHHLNIRFRINQNLQDLAERIVTELDILSTQSLEADLDRPAHWNGILTQAEITDLACTWLPLRDQLLKDCERAIKVSEGAAVAAARAQLAGTLEQIMSKMAQLNSEMLKKLCGRLIELTT